MNEWNRNSPPDSRLVAIERKIYELLAQNPDGLDITQIRTQLGVGEEQEHLDRRIRALRKYYHVPGKHEGGRYVYRLKGAKKGEVGDDGAVSGRLRSEIIHLAKSRCQMCGRTVEEDGIKLQVDHKIPQAWGGLTEKQNLWAICEQCNNGKRDYFQSFDIEHMKEIIAYDSVHERIAHLLKLHMKEPVDSDLIEFVANATERQEDWHKRLRELRYPPIGLIIKTSKRKTPEGHVKSAYALQNWRELPPDHRKLIRAWDQRNKKKKSSD